MNIYLAMENPTLLSRRLTLEGDTVVDNVNDSDLVLNIGPIVSDRSNVPVVGGDYEFPSAIVKGFGYEAKPHLAQGDHGWAKSFIVSRWFDRSDGLGSQVLFSLPLVGLMNYNLSLPTVVGIATRYVDSSPLVESFNSEPLIDTLKAMKYSGFVSLAFDSRLRVERVYLGLPFNGIYNVLEGVPGKLSDFFSDYQHNNLLESWTVGILVTRYPYPRSPLGKRIWFKNIIPDFEKHFYFFDLNGPKKALYTNNNMIGLATSWAETLSEANRRALFTAQTLDVPDVQYRTDLSRMTSVHWHELQDLKVVGSSIEAETPTVT